MREWIVGRNPVYEVLRADRRQVFRIKILSGAKDKGRLSDIISLCEKREIQISKVSLNELNAINSNHQGIALEVSDYPYKTVYDILENARFRGEAPFLLFLDTLQDPQNLGTLLRTAEIVGVHGVFLPYRRTATITPAVVNASSGATEHMMVSQVNISQTIALLKEEGVWVIGLETENEAKVLFQVQLDGPLALVVGSEGKGMRSLVKRSCDHLLKLPMRGKVDSLNAAVAGSIVLYLAWQARGFS